MNILIKPILFICGISALSQAQEKVSLHHLIPSGVPLNGASPTQNLGFSPKLQPYSDFSSTTCPSERTEEEAINEDAPIFKSCIDINGKPACCAYYTETAEGPTILNIEDPNAEHPSPNLLNNCLFAFTRHASNYDESLPFLGSFLKKINIPLDWDNYFAHDEKNSANPAYKEFLKQGACNQPNDKQITPIHRAAREADFATLEYCLAQHSQDVLLNPQAYFTSQTLQDCSAIPTSLTELDQVPLNQFTYPFVVVQNQCNTYIKMKNGSLLTLKLASALDVHNLLSKRYLESIGADFVPTENTLQIYLNPGHAFFGISCKSCGPTGSPFDKRIGFYPTDTRPLGTLCDELKCEGKTYSDENNYLKIVIPIDDKQAEKVFKKIVEIEASNPSYHAYLRNCLDVTQEIFQEISSSHFLNFFTSEQLHMLPIASQRAIQYAVYENQYYLPIRAIVTGLQNSLSMADLLTRQALSGFLNPITQKIFRISPFPSLSKSDYFNVLPYIATIVASSLALDGIKMWSGSSEMIVSLNEVLPAVGVLGYSLYEIAKSPLYTNSMTSRAIPYVTQMFFAVSVSNLISTALKGTTIDSELEKTSPEETVSFLPISGIGALLGLAIFGPLKLQQTLNEFRAPIGGIYIQG